MPWPIGHPAQAALLSSQFAVASTNLALSSAYAAGSTGAGVAAMWTPFDSGNITDIWVYVESYTGTWASTDQNIQFILAAADVAARQPGTAITTVNLALNGSTTGWVKLSGFSIAVTAGRLYNVILSDSDGGASNYVTLKVSNGTGTGVNSATTFFAIAHTTTGGWATTGTQTNQWPMIGLKVGSYVYVGGHLAITSANQSSLDRRRGCRFQVPVPCTLVGAWSAVNPYFIFQTGHAIELYADGTAPGGTTLVSVTCQDVITAENGNLISPYYFPTASRYDLAADTYYRFVLNPDSAVVYPRKNSFVGSPDADIIAAAAPWGGTGHWIEDDGGGGWTSDTSAYPDFSPILIPRAGSGAGRSPFTSIIQPIGTGL